ncbi:hypothetical protein DXT88_06040 [Herbaspirillum lusitanum]|uniref:hypothetical protein n=1 Tax=Herbaspirillum lusitanum TaxID=213312 RepID=UPI002237CE5D|nr:hypothetical protein [Herbaspirillum lusitanum]MCW5297733.1 hypothetical protein [Herbaspirillum lusitanum]
METEDDFEDEDNEGRDPPRYEGPEEIDFMALPRSLGKLHFFWDDMFLRSQAINLALVDQFLTEIEYQNLRVYLLEERTPGETYFLLAQSQMWIFAAYELVRTWDQRIRELIKWHANSGLEVKLKFLKEKFAEDDRYGVTIRIKQIEKILSGEIPISEVDAHRRHLHIQFKRLEWLRVALAKHEVSGSPNTPARMPGYGRINQWCGSLDFELENEKYGMGYVNRRDVANGLRYLDLTLPAPSKTELDLYDDFMSGKISK